MPLAVAIGVGIPLGGVAGEPPTPAAPANTGLPVISGVPTEGETLSTTNGTWSGYPSPTFAYQWERDGGDISGATSQTYELVGDDVDAMITVTVTATNGSGSDDATSAAVGPVEGLPGDTISAPLDVTWVDGTNPVECVMNIDWVAPGDVRVGDIPQVRYNGGGTVYSGAAVAVVPENPDFSGASLPTQPTGAGYAQYRYVRDPGGPGEVIGAWSSASEGAFDIVASGDLWSLEDNSGTWLLEDSSGSWQLESA